MYSTFFLRMSRTAWSVLSGVHSSDIDRCIPVDKVIGARNPGYTIALGHSLIHSTAW